MLKKVLIVIVFILMCVGIYLLFLLNVIPHRKFTSTDFGIDLKALIDKDIENNIDEYQRVRGNPDPNIDFRRVPNQLTYFNRHAENLTTNLEEIEEWMPGDIVVFGDNHIGVVSDVRNSNGIPFIIHSGSNYQLGFEEDKLELLEALKGISGHFRIDLS